MPEGFPVTGSSEDQISTVGGEIHSVAQDFAPAGDAPKCEHICSHRRLTIELSYSHHRMSREGHYVVLGMGALRVLR